MIYNDATFSAFNIAIEVHKGQLDKSGLPYIFHPVHLAEQMNNTKDTVVSLLHDVFEDGDGFYKGLIKDIFTNDIIKSLELLTHNESDDYMQYIQKIKDSGDESAIRVKTEDLIHNMDLTRLPRVRQKDLDRNEKYKQALEILKGDN